MNILLREDIDSISKKYAITTSEILLIMSEVVGRDYIDLFFEKKFLFSQEQHALLIEYLQRRSKKEPISKIIKRKEFYGIDYKTNSATLDPRPETELIVDSFQKYFPNKERGLKILDLGSGTGCIGLSILSLYPNASCEFADISQDALNVCIENAQTLDLYSRCKFTISDWFSNIGGKFDVIVSNPPYISEDYELDGEVLYDPHIALYAGKDGMDAYKEIVPNLVTKLNAGGIAILEIGYDQIEKLLELNQNLSVLEIVKDLNKYDRVIVFRG